MPNVSYRITTTQDEVLEAIDAADKAFKEWSQVSVSRRTQMMFKWRNILVEHLDELTYLCAKELGKNLSEARGDVLKAIEAQSDFSFFYNNNLIDPELRVTVSKRNAPIPEVLGQVFAGTPYSYRIVDKQVLISKKESAPKPGGPLKIQGQVTDLKGNPIVGATVVNMRTLQGTATGIDGYFELTVPALTEDLTFNYIGFKTKVLPASNASMVQLEEATVLEDVVVVGYGTVKRVNLTGSVATIDMKEKANQPITNTTQAMYNTPGVWINQNLSLIHI